MSIKKLIEVALPLEKINDASGREKSLRHGHPSTLHLWWARRPLATTRAIIWASLVDDPSSHPERFPDEASQSKERERLFKIIEELVVWENTNNETVLKKAKDEIRKSMGETEISMLDPFAGGGAIPVEAQRLGLTVNAHDLNPVAVMINKAMEEIPSRFSGIQPVNPASNVMGDSTGFTKAEGIANDVHYYGMWIKEQAQKRIGDRYPLINLNKNENANVIAWIWTRTTSCPNPACGLEMPLSSSFILSKKKGKEAWVEPILENGQLKFNVHQGKCPKDKETNKVGRSALFKCPFCGEVTTDEYCKQKGKEHKLGMRMMAIVAEEKKGSKGRRYLNTNIEQEMAANVHMPEDYPNGAISTNPRWFSPPAFGMEEFADIFTPRQLTAMTTFCDLAIEARSVIEKDAIRRGMDDDHISLRDGGKGARAYGEAIGVYLSFIIDKIGTRLTTLCNWDNGYTKISNMFSRQAMPMVWDFAEGNVFSNSTGSYDGTLKLIEECILELPCGKVTDVSQFDAQSDCGLRNIMISTDPPYYDNIGYADLSDFFYIWMRRTLRDVYPDLFKTMLTPKREELIATPQRFDGKMDKAKEFFENGMSEACKQIYKYASDNIPVTIYYAYRQSETERAGNSNGTASTGWETMLTAIINSGFSITGTWPVRTELTTALKSKVNALASSIVLVCRKRNDDSNVCTRRNFVNELKRELRPALKKLQESSIAPVDLAQSAIGPGIGVYSRYAKVLEADGTPMTVRSALQIINQELDLYFNEQEGDLDTESRFCIELYSQMAFNEMPFGDANTLATAKNTSVAIMASHGTLYAQKGKVHLIERPELPTSINEHEGSIWLLCQQLTYKMEKEGIEGCAASIANMYGSNSERAKDLAYRLYTIAERKKWAQEAYAYNALVVAWPEIQSRAAELKAIVPRQLTLEDFMNNNN